MKLEEILCRNRDTTEHLLTYQQRLLIAALGTSGAWATLSATFAEVSSRMSPEDRIAIADAGLKMSNKLEDVVDAIKIYIDEQSSHIQAERDLIGWVIEKMEKK